MKRLLIALAALSLICLLSAPSYAGGGLFGFGRQASGGCANGMCGVSASVGYAKSYGYAGGYGASYGASYGAGYAPSYAAPQVYAAPAYDASYSAGYAAGLQARRAQTFQAPAPVLASTRTTTTTVTQLGGVPVHAAPIAGSVLVPAGTPAGAWERETVTSRRGVLGATRSTRVVERRGW
jgi:hypothetical protein